MAGTGVFCPAIGQSSRRMEGERKLSWKKKRKNQAR